MEKLSELFGFDSSIKTQEDVDFDGIINHINENFDACQQALDEMYDASDSISNEYKGFLRYLYYAYGVRLYGKDYDKPAIGTAAHRQRLLYNILRPLLLYEKFYYVFDSIVERACKGIDKSINSLNPHDKTDAKIIEFLQATSIALKNDVTDEDVINYLNKVFLSKRALKPMRNLLNGVANPRDIWNIAELLAE